MPAIWPPRTPPPQRAAFNGRSDYHEYDTKRGPNALFSPQAEAVKSVGDVIAAIDFDNDMHVQAAEFQHGLLEALLRLWCTPQSVPAVQLEVQSSLADLIPSEMVRLHLLESFTQQDAYAQQAGQSLPVDHNGGGFHLLSVASPEDAEEWQQTFETELNEAPASASRIFASGRGLDFADTADFDAASSAASQDMEVVREGDIEYVKETLFLPSSTMAGGWFRSVAHKLAPATPAEHAGDWDDAATDGTRDTLDTPARMAGDPEGKAAPSLEQQHAPADDAPPFLFVRDPVLLALLFQQVGRAQPSTLGIHTVLWVPLYARSTNACIGFLEFWNRVPQGFGLQAAPALDPTPLQPITSHTATGRHQDGTHAVSTTPRRNLRQRRVHMADSAFPTHVAAVDGAFDDEEGPPKTSAGTAFHEGDLAVLQLLATPISIALHHAVYYASTSDDVAAMHHAVDSLQRQVQAAQATAAHHQARDGSLMKALGRSGEVQAALARQLAADSHDWPALRLAAGLSAFQPLLPDILAGRITGGQHLRVPRPLCLAPGTITRSLKEVAAAVASWARASAPLLLGEQEHKAEQASPAIGSARVWFSTSVLQAMQLGGVAHGTPSGGGGNQGPFTAPSGGFWSPSGPNGRSSGGNSAAGSSCRFPSRGLVAAALRSMKPRVACSHDAEYNAADDGAFGIVDGATVVVVPLTMLAPGQTPPTPASRPHPSGSGKRDLRLFFPEEEQGASAATPPRVATDSMQQTSPAPAQCLGVLLIQVQGGSTQGGSSALQAGAVAVGHSIELYLGYLMASHSSVLSTQREHAEMEHWFRRTGSALGAVLAHAASMRSGGSPQPPASDPDAAPSAAGLCLPQWRLPTPHSSPARAGDLLAAASYALAHTVHSMFQRLAASHPVHTALQLAGSSPALQACLGPAAGPPQAAASTATFGFAPPPLVTSGPSASVTADSVLHVVSMHIGLVTQVPTAWIVSGGPAVRHGGGDAPPTPRGHGHRPHIAWDSSVPESPGTASDGGTPNSEHAALVLEGADYAAATGLCVMAGAAPAPSAFTAAALQQAARHAGYSTAGLFQVNLRTASEGPGANERTPGSARRSRSGRSSHSGSCVLVWARGAHDAALYVPRTATARAPQVAADVLRLDDDFKFLGHVAAPDDAEVWCPDGNAKGEGALDDHWSDVAVVSVTCMPGSYARWHHVVLQSVSLGMRSRVNMPAGLARGDADTSAYPAVGAITTLRLRVPSALLGQVVGKGGAPGGVSPSGSLDASVQPSTSADLSTAWEEPATPFGAAASDPGTPQYALAARVTAAAQLLLPLLSPCLISTAQEAMAKSAEGASRVWSARWSTVAAASVAAPALTGVLSDPSWLRQGDTAWWGEATSQLRAAMGAHGVVLYRYNGDLRLLEAVQSNVDDKAMVHLAGNDPPSRNASREDSAWDGTSTGGADGLGFSPTGTSRSGSRGRRRATSPGAGLAGGSVLPVADILSGYGVLPDSCLAGVGPLGSAWGDQRLLRQVVTVKATPQTASQLGGMPTDSPAAAAAAASGRAAASSGAARPTSIQVELLAFPVSTSALTGNAASGPDRSGVGGAGWCADMAALSGARISPSALVALLSEAEGQNGTHAAGPGSATDAIVPVDSMGHSTAPSGGSGDTAGSTVLVAVARVIGPVPRSANRGAPTAPSEALAHVTACVGAAQARHTLQHCLSHLNSMQRVVGDELQARSNRAHSTAERATAAMQDKLEALQEQYDALAAQLRGVSGQALSSRSRVTELHSYVREAHLAGRRGADDTGTGRSVSNDSEGSVLTGPAAGKRSASFVWDAAQGAAGQASSHDRFGQPVTLAGATGTAKERSSSFSEGGSLAGRPASGVGPHPGAAAALDSSRTGSGNVAQIMSTLFHTDLSEATRYASDSLVNASSHIVPTSSSSMPMNAPTISVDDSSSSSAGRPPAGPLPAVVLHSTADAFHAPIIDHTRKMLHAEHARLWLVDAATGHMWTHVPFIGSGGHALASGSKATVTRVTSKQRPGAVGRVPGTSSAGGEDGDGSIWEMRFTVAHGLVGHVARTGQAMVVTDAAEHARYDADVDALDGGDSGNALLVPVLMPRGFVAAEDGGGHSKGGPKRVVGVLQLRNKTSLSYVLECSTGLRAPRQPTTTAAAAATREDSTRADSILTPFAAADVYGAAVSSRVLGAALAAHALGLQAHERFVNTGAKLARLHSQAAAEAFSRSEAGHIVHRGGEVRTRSAFLDGVQHEERQGSQGGRDTDYSSTIRSQARVQLLLECAAMLVTPTDIGSLAATAAEVIPTLLGVPAAATIVLAPSTPEGQLSAVVAPVSPGAVGGGATEPLSAAPGSRLHRVVATGNRCVDTYTPSDAPADASAANKRSANLDSMGGATGAAHGSKRGAGAFSLEEQVMLRDLLLRSRIGGYASRGSMDGTAEEGGAQGGYDPGMAVLMLPLIADRTPRLGSAHASKAGKADAHPPSTPGAAGDTHAGFVRPSGTFGVRGDKDNTSSAGRYIVGVLLVQIPNDELVSDEVMLTGAAGPGGNGMGQFTVEHHTMMLLHVAHVLSGTLARHALHSALSDSLGGAMQALVTLQSASESMAVDLLWERSEALAAEARQRAVLRRMLTSSLHDATAAAQSTAAHETQLLSSTAATLTRSAHRSHEAVAKWLRRGVHRSSDLLSSCVGGDAKLRTALAQHDPTGTMVPMATPSGVWRGGRADAQLAVQPFAVHPALGATGEPEGLIRGLPQSAQAFLNEILSPISQSGVRGGGVGSAVLRTLFWIASGTHSPGSNLPRASVLAWGSGRTPTLLLPLSSATAQPEAAVTTRALQRAGDALFDWCADLLQESARMAKVNSALEAQIVLRCSVAGNEYAVLLRALPTDTLQKRAALQRRSRVSPLELWELLGGERSDLPSAEAGQMPHSPEDDGASDDESARSVASADAATRQRVPGTLPVVACLFPCAGVGAATAKSRRGPATNRRLPQPTGPGIELTVLPAVLWEALQMNAAGCEFVAPDERRGDEGGVLQLQRLPLDAAGRMAEQGTGTTAGAQAPQSIRVQSSYRAAVRSCSHIQALPLDDVLSSPHLGQTIEAASVASRHARADGAAVRLPSVPLLLTGTTRAQGWDAGRVAASFPGYSCDQKGRPVPLADPSANGWPDIAEEEGLLDEQSAPRRRWVAHSHPLSVGSSAEKGAALGEVRFVWSVEVQPEQEDPPSTAEEEHVGGAEWVSENSLPQARVLPTQGVLGATPHDLQLSIPALLHVNTIQMMCTSVAHTAALGWHRTAHALRAEVLAACMSSAARTTEALTQLTAVSTRDSSAARAALATVRAINAAGTLPALTAAVVHCVPHLLQVIACSDHGDAGAEAPVGSAPSSLNVRASLFVQRRVLGQCNAEKEAFTEGQGGDDDAADDGDDVGSTASDEDDDSTVWSDASDDEDGSDNGAPSLLGSTWSEWVRVTPGEVVPVGRGDDDTVQFSPSGASSVYADNGDDSTEAASGAAVSGVRGILKKPSSRGVAGGAKKRTLSFGGQGMGGGSLAGSAPDSSARSVGALLAGGALAIEDIATEDGVLPAAGGAVGKSARTRESLLVTSTQNADVALFPAERLLSPLGAVLTLPLPPLLLHSLAVADTTGASEAPPAASTGERPSALGGFARHTSSAVLRMEEGRFPREAAAPKPTTAQVVLPTGVSAVLLVATSAPTVAAPHCNVAKEAFSPAALAALALVRDALTSSLSRIVQEAQSRYQLEYMGRIARRLQYRLNRALATSHDFGVQLQRVLTTAFNPPATRNVQALPDSGMSISASQMGPTLHNVSYAGDSPSDDGSALGMGGGSMMDSEPGYGDGSTAVVRMRARLDTLRSCMGDMCAQVNSDGAEVLVSSEYIVRCVMGNLLHALPAHVAVQHAIVETAGAAAAAGKPVSLAAALSMNAAAPLALASLPALYTKVRSCVMSALSSGVPALGSASDSNLLATGSTHVLVPLHSGFAALEAALDMLLSSTEEGEGGPAVAWHRLVGAGGEDDGPIIGTPHAPHECLDMGACGHQPRSHFLLAGLGDTLAGGSVSSPFTAASSVVSGVDGPSGISSSVAFGMGSVPALQSLQEERPIVADAPVGAAQDSWLTTPLQVPLAVVAARAKGVKRRQGRSETQPMPSRGTTGGRRPNRPEVPKGDAIDAVLRDIAEKAGVGAAAAGLGGSHGAGDEVLGVSRANLQAEVAARAVAHVAAFPIRPGQGALTDPSADAEDVVALADRAMAMAAASQQAAARTPGTSVVSGRGGSDASTVNTGGDASPTSGGGRVDQSGVFSADLPSGLQGRGHEAGGLTAPDVAGAAGRAAAYHATPFGVVQLVTVKSRASRTARMAEAGSAKHKQRAARAAQADAQRQLLMHVHASAIGQLAAGLMWELTSFSIQRTLAGRMHRAVAFMRSLRLAYSSVRQHWAAERAQALVAHAAVRGATATNVAVSRSLDALDVESVQDDPDWRLRAEEAHDRRYVSNEAGDERSLSGADERSNVVALTPTVGRTVRMTAPSEDVFSAVRSMLTGVMAAICKGLPAVTGAAGAVMWWSLSRELAQRCGLLRAGDANPSSPQRTAAGLPGSASADDSRVWVAAVPSVHSGGANVFAMADGEGLVKSAVMARSPFVAGDASGRDERYEAPEGRALRAAIQGALPHDLLDLSSIVQVAGNEQAAYRVHGPSAGAKRSGGSSHAHRAHTDQSIALGTVVCIPFSASARGGASSPVRGVVELVMLRTGSGTSADCLANAKPAMRAVKAAGSLLTALTHAVDAAEHALSVHAAATGTIAAVAADRERLHGSLGEHMTALKDTQQELQMVRADLGAVSEQLATVRAGTARERRISRMFEGAMGHLWSPLLRPVQAPQIVSALQLAHPSQQWDAQTQNARTGALVRWVNGFCVDIGAAAVRVFLSADAVSRLVTKADPLTLADPAQYEDSASVRSSVISGAPAGERSDLVLAAEALLNGFAQGPEAGRIQLGLLRSQDGPGGDAFERRHTVVARDDVQVQGAEEQGRPDVVTVAAPLLVSADTDMRDDGVQAHVAQFACIGALYVEAGEQVRYDQAQVDLISLTARILAGGIMQYAAWGNMMAASADLHKAQRALHRAEELSRQAQQDCDAAATQSAESRAEAQSMQQAAARAESRLAEERAHAESLQRSLEEADLSLTAVRAREAALRDQVDRYREMETEMEEARAVVAHKQGQVDRLQTAYEELRAQMKQYVRLHKTKKSTSEDH